MRTFHIFRRVGYVINAKDGGIYRLIVVVASKAQGDNPRGVFKIADTGWDITSSRVGMDETIFHSGKDKLSIVAMRHIDEIIKNAVSLDTEVSEHGRGKKSVYTAFMHKFYCPVIVNGIPCIAKLTVDESYQPGAEETNKKFYHVRAMKIEPDSSVGIGINHTPIMEDSSSIIKVADLFDAVKRMDADFQPKPASKVVNEDGTPKEVYHGTISDFWAFYGGAYFTDDYMNADGYASGERIVEAYLSMINPLIIDCKGAKWDDLDTEYGSSTQEIIGNADNATYDGVIFENINDSWMDDAEYGDISTVYYPFKNTQIKSSTDNVGTFDGSNPDIRYKLPVMGDKQSATTLTKQDLRELLQKASAGEMNDGTYFPVRTNTPDILLQFIKRVEIYKGVTGKELERAAADHPMVIPVVKAKQAMAIASEWYGEGDAHEFAVEDVINIIQKMDTPRYLVYEESTGRYIEIVNYVSVNGNKAVAVVEVDEYKGEQHMNGYDSDRYSVLVTLFPPDGKDRISALLNNWNNIVYDVEKRRVTRKLLQASLCRQY